MRGVGIAVAELRHGLDTARSRRRQALGHGAPAAPASLPSGSCERLAARHRGADQRQVGVGLGGAQRGVRLGLDLADPALRGLDLPVGLGGDLVDRAASAATLSCSVPISARSPSTWPR